MKNQETAEKGEILICPHLQQLFVTAPNPVCCLDANGNFLHLSEKFLHLFGTFNHELVGKNFLSIVTDSSKEESEEGMKRIRESKVVQFYNSCIKKDGSSFPAFWSCSWNENEGYILCFVRDETDKKFLSTIKRQFQEEIEEHSWEISNILDRLGDGFFAVDQNFRITYANPKVEQILNVNKNEYLNRILWDCFPEMNESIFFEQYQKALKEKISVHFEGFLPSLNCWYEVHAYPSETGLSVLFRDINKRIKSVEDKRRLEVKYREQNKMMVDVLEQMNSGFLTIRLDGKILYWNRESEKITGIKRHQVINKMIWEVFPGLETTPYFKLYEYLLENKGPIYKEIYSPFRKRWLAINAYTTPNGISVFFRDIDEKKKTEEEVHKLSLIVKGTANGVCIVEMDGNVSWVNEAYTRITGYSFDEIKGKNPHKLLVGDNCNAQVHDHIRECFVSGQAWKEEILCYNKNKEVIWLECNGKPLYDLEGKFNQYFLIFTEITERKNAEKELHKLSLIAEQTVNAVAISDGNQKIIWVNKACLELSGYSLEEAIGKSTHELFDGPETDADLINYAKECVQKRIPFRIETLNYKKNGETYWADVSCQPLFDKGGELQCFFSIATDITERKILEQQLEAQRNNTTAAVIAAQERERALVGQELHDNVNQVLTTVKLYTELCRDGIGNVEDLYEKSLSLLQNSINEIRNLSKRLSAPTLGNIRLSDSVKELVEAISGTNKVAINLDVCGLEQLEVSQELHLALYRILQEHFTNILKHSEAVKVDVVLEPVNDKLILSVKDDGKGFDLNEKRYGIGITNMITRTDSLNGNITFNTSPGKGCELLVVLPLK